MCFFFFFQAEDGIRDYKVTGVQTCALPISRADAGVAARTDADREEVRASGRRSGAPAVPPAGEPRVRADRRAPRRSRDGPSPGGAFKAAPRAGGPAAPPPRGGGPPHPQRTSAN